MYIQLYERETNAAVIFLTASEIVGKMHGDRKLIDRKLNILGWRRAEKWQECTWGCQAKLRRIK